MSATGKSGWAVGEQCSYYDRDDRQYQSAVIVEIDATDPEPFKVQVEGGETTRAVSVY